MARTAPDRMFLIFFTLVPRNPEIAFCCSLPPGAGDLAMVGTDIVQFALGCDVSRAAGRILRIRLDPNCPVRHIQENTRERNGIRSGIDNARDILAIPIHNNGEVIPLSRCRSPITGPRPSQRMALLGEHKKCKNETCDEAKQLKHTSPYHRFATISLYLSGRNVLTAPFVSG